jgi:putative transposase
VIDSCSIKTSPVRGPRGFDGAKKIDGIKRHIVVDTLGLLVAVLVIAASVQDRAALPRLLGRAAIAAPGSASVGRPGLTGSVVQAVSRILRSTIQIVGGIKPRAALLPSLVAGSSSGPSPVCTAADASPASTADPIGP